MSRNEDVLLTAHFEEAEVVQRRQAWKDAVRLRLRAPAVASTCRPGQFVMVGPLCVDGFDPFLNRPYSIFLRPGPDCIELLVGVVGRQSERISRLAPGDTVGLLGPLGRGFSVPAESRRVLAAGGGLGVAPLAFLAEEQARAGRRVTLVHGARSADRLCPFPELQQAGAEVLCASEDGSAGRKGTAVDLAEEVLSREGSAEGYLAGCGPRPMLQALAGLAARLGLPCEVALETRMACGVGACLGCTERLAGGGQARVCREGPVFPAQEVFAL